MARVGAGQSVIDVVARIEDPESSQGVPLRGEVLIRVPGEPPLVRSSLRCARRYDAQAGMLGRVGEFSVVRDHLLNTEAERDREVDSVL